MKKTKKDKSGESEWQKKVERGTLGTGPKGTFMRMLIEKDSRMGKPAVRVTPNRKVDFAKSPAQRRLRDIVDFL